MSLRFAKSDMIDYLKRKGYEVKEHTTFKASSGYHGRPEFDDVTIIIASKDGFDKKILKQEVTSVEAKYDVERMFYQELRRNLLYNL